MHLEYIRSTEKSIPKIDSPLEVQSLKIWYCKFTDISEISECKNIEILSIAGYPYDTLEILRSFPKLKELHLLKFNKVTNIGPLEQLEELHTITLHTPPSWDSSGKKQYIDTLKPLSGLKNLKEIELFGVLPQGDITKELTYIDHVTKKRFSQYPKNAKIGK